MASSCAGDGVGDGRSAHDRGDGSSQVRGGCSEDEARRGRRQKLTAASGRSSWRPPAVGSVGMLRAIRSWERAGGGGKVDRSLSRFFMEKDKERRRIR
jgi:hypothetical protein